MSNGNDYKFWLKGGSDVDLQESTDITIKQLQEKREQLERDLYSANEKLISEFQKETGVNISRVDVNLGLIETIGEPDKYIVMNVGVDLDI